MKPYQHALRSAKKYGGVPEDYIKVHDWLDQTKMSYAVISHRAILHNTFGCYLVEQIFGHDKENSEGKHWSPRQVAEDHIIEDLGTILTLERWLSKIPLEPWMAGGVSKYKENIYEGIE